MPWLDPGDNLAQIGFMHSFGPQNFFVAGRGAGKTAVLCKKYEALCRMFPGITCMITEQTSRDINDILIPTWDDVVTPGISTRHGNGGLTEIRFRNRSKVWFRSRQAKRANDDPPFRGPTVGAVGHDELALDRREDVLEISGMMLRQKGMPNCIDVTTTPKPNWLYRYVMSCGVANPITSDSDRIQISRDGTAAAFYGRTADNQHNCGLDARMRARLSERDAQQELDAIWVMNEGLVWQQFKEKQWPLGNMIDSPWDRSKPSILGVDLGGANSAWGLYQLEHHTSHITGQRVQLLVAKAEWTPHGREPWLVLEEIKQYLSRGHYKAPLRIKVGSDYRSPGTVGTTAEHMFDAHGWGRIVDPITGFYEASKDVQHRQAAMLICNSLGHRQFCVSNQLESFYPGRTRGILDMLRHDTYPEPGSKDYFRKEKSMGIYHEDSRDQFLYTCVGVYPPDFAPQIVYPK